MSAPAADPNPLPVTKTGGFNYLALLARVAVLGLLLSSVGLLWWSYYRVFAPRLRESRELNATLAVLTAGVDVLDRRWSRAEIEQINQKFELVKPRLFADQPDLESWLADFREQLAPSGLEIKTDLANSTVSGAAGPGLFAVPATMFITFPPGSGSAAKPSPYQRLLQFSRSLTTQEKSADLTELTVESGAGSIGRAVLRFNFWAGAKESK